MTETNKNIKDFTSKQGNKYKFQKVKPSIWLGVMDKTRADKENESTVLYTEVLEKIVVQPQMSLDDFDSVAELDEVVKAAINFQRG